MQVAELMSTDVASIAPQDSLQRAAQLMWDFDCGCLPVCEADGVRRVVSVITDRDVCMAALFSGLPLRDIPVRSAMSRHLWTASPEDDVGTAEECMREAQIRRLPVVDAAGALVGVLSLADIAREAEREQSGLLAVVTEQEVGDTLAGICRPFNGGATTPGASPASA